MTDREAAAGLVEYYNSVAKTGVLITYTAKINAKPTADLITTLLSELESVWKERDNLKLQAQGHASEARSANATIYDAYQAVTGATGEPGNWNGAEPIKVELDRLRALVAEAVRVCEPISALATAHFLRYETTPGVFREAHQGDPDDKPVYGINSTYLLTGHLRAARAFIDRAKEVGNG